MADDTDKITQEELQRLFGDMIPMEAVQIIYNAPASMTVAECRAKLKAIAEQNKPLPINHEEALQLANMNWETSNLSRCYNQLRIAIEAMRYDRNSDHLLSLVSATNNIRGQK